MDDTQIKTTVSMPFPREVGFVNGLCFQRGRHLPLASMFCQPENFDRQKTKIPHLSLMAVAKVLSLMQRLENYAAVPHSKSAPFRLSRFNCLCNSPFHAHNCQSGLKTAQHRHRRRLPKLLTQIQQPSLPSKCNHHYFPRHSPRG